MTDVTPFTTLRQQMTSEILQESLRTAHPDIALTCMLNGIQHTLPSGENNTLTTETPVEVGCMARNMTALLFAIASAEGRVDFHDTVGSFFPAGGSFDPSLKVFHLLNGTHGLDGSSIDRIPYNDDGRIDSALLWKTANTERAISAPGAMFYYYGNIGLWLAAAILERLYDTTFAQLLSDKLLLRINVVIRPRGSSAICPATGGFELSASELLRLGCFHLEEHDEPLAMAIRQLRDDFLFTLPKWTSVGESAGAGWFRYRDSSFGMFARTEGSSSHVMVFPEQKSAMALTGRGENAFQAARLAITGKLLEDSGPPTPRLLTRNEQLALPLGSIVGTYRKSSLILDISCNSRNELRAAVYRPHRNGKELELLVSRSLLPVSAITFFPASPEPTLIPFLTLEGTDADGKFSHVCTARHTFRRIS